MLSSYLLVREVIETQPAWQTSCRLHFAVGDVWESREGNWTFFSRKTRINLFKLLAASLSSVPTERTSFSVDLVWKGPLSTAMQRIRDDRTMPSLTHLSKNRQLLHQQMGALGLPGSTLSTDHNTLQTGSHTRVSKSDFQPEQKKVDIRKTFF